MVRRLMARIRRRHYARGGRPKPGTILYSPTLTLQIAACEGMATMQAAFLATWAMCECGHSLVAHAETGCADRECGCDLDVHHTAREA